MSDTVAVFKILMPEWQGCGVSVEMYDGARVLAREWWPDGPDLIVDAPREESLATTGAVLGLTSIAPRFAEALAQLRAAAPSHVVVVGGTCGVELAPVAYCHALHADDLAVVWLDAHGDLNTPASSPSGHFHGMVLRTLLGDGPAELRTHLGRPLEPEQVFLVGARDLDQPEHDYVARGGVTWLGPDVCDRPDDLVDQINRGGFSRVYVHFDVDVIDPGSFSSGYFQVPGGPSLGAVADTIGALHRHFDVVGFSVLEYCDRGESDRSRLVAALRGAT